VASDFVRQISSPFTTRLVLVFASWADENIIRIETVQDAFVALSQIIFLLLDFEKKLIKKCVKCLKRPEVLLGTFRESTGTEQWRHLTARLFSEVVPLIRREIFPSIYVRNLQAGEKCRKNFGGSPNGTVQNGIGRPRSTRIRHQKLEKSRQQRQLPSHSRQSGNCVVRERRTVLVGRRNGIRLERNPVHLRPDSPLGNWSAYFPRCAAG
jgi:hypothetical protein